MNSADSIEDHRLGQRRGSLLSAMMSQASQDARKPADALSSDASRKRCISFSCNNMKDEAKVRKRPPPLNLAAPTPVPPLKKLCVDDLTRKDRVLSLQEDEEDQEDSEQESSSDDDDDDKSNLFSSLLSESGSIFLTNNTSPLHSSEQASPLQHRMWRYHHRRDSSLLDGRQFTLDEDAVSVSTLYAQILRDRIQTPQDIDPSYPSDGGPTPVKFCFPDDPLASTHHHHQHLTLPAESPKRCRSPSLRRCRPSTSGRGVPIKQPQHQCL